jgi:hypothetical protein
LENDSGQSVFDHHQKADLIWQAFKERLAVSDFTSIQFNLHTLMQASDDLSSLVVPFTNQEIDAVIKGLSSDKAPGPDGFNTDFVKKCWPIICEDFYNLCNDFYLYYNGTLKLYLVHPVKRPPLRASNHCAPNKMYTVNCLH